MNGRFNTLGYKIGLGYALMILVAAGIDLITLWQVDKMQDAAARLIDNRVPTAQKSGETAAGIQRSVAALRGWMLTRAPAHLEEWDEAWLSDIRPAVEEMRSLAPQWTNPENSKRFRELVGLIDRLEEMQSRTTRLPEAGIMDAQRIVDQESTPLVREIIAKLEGMSASQTQLMFGDLDEANKQIAFLARFEWGLLLGSLLLGSILGALITRSIARPVAQAARAADEIAGGDLEARIEVGGSREIDALGKALLRMRDSLKARSEAARRRSWIATGKNRLSEAMPSDLGPARLADAIVASLAELLGAGVGALYLGDDDGASFSLVGRYAFSSGQEAAGRFALGEGLVGQAASAGRVLKVDTGSERMRLASGLAEGAPCSVLAAPLVADGRVVGVLELARFEPFPEEGLELVGEVLGSVAIALQSSIARERIDQLLEKTQRQGERLQVQQEELRQTNEELEEQARILKDQQEELKASNEELEEQTAAVEDKNRELEAIRTDIEAKSLQLELSSKYKSEFLANMSHELRTPLNSLLILAGDLEGNREGNLSADQIESAQVISKSGHDLLNLINEILDLAKIEAGKMDIHVSSVEIAEIAGSVRREFHLSAEKKGLEFECLVDSDAPRSIRTDPQRLTQIIRNLVANALKFTRRGGVGVAIRGTAPGGLSIAVSDSGIGIAADRLNVIFEAFRQAEGGTTRKYGGTGLGLSISRELAGLLKGRIEVTSEPGRGSVFTLVLPPAVDGEAVLPPPASVPVPSQRISVPDQREEIGPDDYAVLIIDDDPSFARLLGQQAAQKDFKFLIALSGEEGLSLAAKFLPKAILLDLKLPGIDGHTVLRELKSDPNLRHIPVHILSASEKSLDPIKSGALTYLPKPVARDQLEEVFARIEDFINRKMKNLLVVEDDENLRHSIIKLIGNGDVKCFEASDGEQAIAAMKSERIDCVVLDIGLPDINGFDLLARLEAEAGAKLPPIIVYTGRELSREENAALHEYAETIIVKGVKSEERLLDETALFLHRAVKNLPRQKREMIAGLYDKETMFLGRRVLLVDDDMRNVFALSKVLREKGLEVAKAENGRVALELLGASDGFDMVLMDVMMPEMDGYQCMAEIRREPKFRDLPIIALTAKAMKDDRQKCLHAGANDYIAKPVNIERLLSLMRIWMKR